MLFTNTAILAIMAVVMGAIQSHAGPITPKNEEFVVTSVQTIGDHTLHWYGPAGHANDIDAPPSGSLIKKVCGDSIVTGNCHNSHQASVSSCRLLLDTLRNSGGNSVPTQPRSVCVTQSGNQCCTSWANKLNFPTRFSDLAPAVDKIIRTCAGDRISGLSRDTNLAGTCTTQCLSDRTTGCT